MLLHKLRSLSFGSFALFLGVFTAITTFGWFPNTANQTKKSIEKRPTIGPEIVSIVEINKGEKVIKFKEEIEEGGDWLRGLRFKLRNNSGREIVYLVLYLDFPETTSTGNEMSYRIRLGNRPGGVTQTEAPIFVEPGKELDVTLDEKTYSQLKDFIEHRQVISTLSKVIMDVGFITFSDGLSWSAGEYFRQDPKDPKRYVKISPKQPNQ